ERRRERPQDNVMTVEDPIEYVLSGITQTSVNPRAGLDYPAALRSLMRQDPDTILVGELRGAESAGIALEAALTGHLVLSTIHGNDIAAVLQRLSHFSIAPVLLSQSLNAVVVQRLARKLCPTCVRW